MTVKGARSETEMHITLRRLALEFGIDTTSAQALAGLELEAWLNEAEDRLFLDLYPTGRPWPAPLRKESPMSQSQVEIHYANGFWSATSERWALAAHNNKFRSLERLLSELATMGIRSLSGLSWEELPAADGFNRHAFLMEVDRYISREPLEHLADCAQHGSWMTAAAKLDADGEWRFFLTIAASSQKEFYERMLVHTREQLGYRWVASSFDPGCEDVREPGGYIRQRLEALADGVQRAIAAD